MSEKGANVAVVDFGNVDQIAEALKGATALLSFLAVPEKEEFIRINRNLIKACQQAGVKRFVPGEWAGDASQYYFSTNFY